MTLFPRFIGKVKLSPIDGTPLNKGHVRRFYFALACESIFAVFTGGSLEFYTNAPAPRSSLGQWIRKTFPPRGR